MPLFSHSLHLFCYFGGAWLFPLKRSSCTTFGEAGALLQIVMGRVTGSLRGLTVGAAELGYKIVV